MDERAGAPGPAHGVEQPAVGRPAPVGDVEAPRDALLVGVGAVLGGCLLGLQREGEDLLLLAAEHRQDAVRGQLGEGLGEVEVVGELGARLLLVVADPRDEAATRPHLLAQAADEVGVLGEALDQDGPRALQRGGGVRDALLGVDEGRRGRLRVDRGVGEQPVGERLQPRLPGDLRLGAALGLVREVDVLQARLGVGRHDLRFQRLVELALGADRLQDRRAPLLQLAQVAQPVFERAQLRVVEHLGRFLAVAGDERHGGAAVEQLDGRLHLALAHAELIGDLLMNGDRHDPGPPSH